MQKTRFAGQGHFEQNMKWGLFHLFGVPCFNIKSSKYIVLQFHLSTHFSSFHNCNKRFVNELALDSSTCNHGSPAPACCA